MASGIVARMGSEFHRLVMVALAAGLLVIPGCGAGGTSTASQDGTPTVAAVQPKIVSAEVDGANSLRLTFSEEMQPASGVDPAKFRLTVGYYGRPASASDKYTYAYYSGSYDYARYYGSVGDVGGILSEPTASAQAVLLMGASFDAAAACKQIAAHGANAGLYLHYSDKGTPTLQDPQGNALASAGDYWDYPSGHAPAGASAPIPVALHCN
jgi:hypothetical protein